MPPTPTPPPTPTRWWPGKEFAHKNVAAKGGGPGGEPGPPVRHHPGESWWEGVAPSLFSRNVVRDAGIKGAERGLRVRTIRVLSQAMALGVVAFTLPADKPERGGERAGGPGEGSAIWLVVTEDPTPVARPPHGAWQCREGGGPVSSPPGTRVFLVRHTLGMGFNLPEPLRPGAGEAGRFAEAPGGGPRTEVSPAHLLGHGLEGPPKWSCLYCLGPVHDPGRGEDGDPASLSRGW